MQDSAKARVLVIDDDVDFREMLRVMLAAEGYAPEIAEDAVEGGKALLAERPDVILCDLKMPYMGGLELLSLLRAEPDTSSLPVILVSGQSDIDVLGKAVQLGASDYLIKPLTRERLLKSIATCLEKARGDGDSR
jgi:two-component system sensor histidine kinase/response regulator